MREIDYSQYRTDTYRYYSQQFAPIRAMKPEDGAERFYPPGAGLQEALYFWIFPNLMLNIYPDNLSTNLIVPLSHDKTLTIFEWFFHEANSEKVRERIQRAVAFSDEVQQEDIELCRNVQRGLKFFDVRPWPLLGQTRKWRPPFPHASQRISLQAVIISLRRRAGLRLPQFFTA